MSETRDLDIRAALHTKKLHAYRAAPNTLVVDELGLSHAKVRIDIAVINGCVHGYEIKSSLDTLNRLPTQLDLYSQCLEKVTFVCAPQHVDGIIKLAPGWCGIIVANKGARGAISFKRLRRTGSNPSIDPVQLAHLLWRGEAASLLASLDPDRNIRKRPRKELYADLATLLTVSQLTAAIRDFMGRRSAWRGPPVHALCGG